MKRATMIVVEVDEQHLAVSTVNAEGEVLYQWESRSPASAKK